MAEPVRKMPADEEPEPDWRREYDNPFPYGFRWRRVRLPNGEESDEQIPLTPQDILDPEFGDEVPQSGPHFKLVTLLGELLLRHYEDREDVLVLGDVQIFWGIPGLSNPAPDLAVIPGVREKDKERKAFYVAEEGARPCLVIEVVSDSDVEMRRNDYEKKVEIYQRAGVREYLIFDQPFSEKGRFRMTGYRLGAGGRYRRIEPDPQGRLLAESAGLLFAVDQAGTLLVADVRTGEPIRTGVQEAEARKAAEERAEREAEARKAAESELARLRAELARRDTSDR